MRPYTWSRWKIFFRWAIPIVHERSHKILQPQTQGHSDIDDQCQAYYQAAGGEKIRRVYSLESQAKSYHSPNLHTSSRSNATSLATLLNVKSTLIGNLFLNVPSTLIGNVEELVMQLIPILMDHMLPIFVEGGTQSTFFTAKYSYRPPISCGTYCSSYC